MCALIFKQLAEVVNGTKTQTRRLVKPGEAFSSNEIPNWIYMVAKNKRIKWQIGRDYAVKSSMYSRAVWINEKGGIELDWTYEAVKRYTSTELQTPLADLMKRDGWQPLRVRITDIRQQRLQEISEQDAIAEGIIPVPNGADEILYRASTLKAHYFYPVEAYAALWNSINTTKKTRWEANPYVWVLNFEVVR